MPHALFDALHHLPGTTVICECIKRQPVPVYAQEVLHLQKAVGVTVMDLMLAAVSDNFCFMQTSTCSSMLED